MSDEEKARELISWFLPDKKSIVDDVSGEQKSDAEKVSGGENLVTIINKNDFMMTCFVNLFFY
ncbi:MAG: hypothetical protein KJ685_02750 [Nanoarchaeota archaeon]|nr:hypothetical protein [Nanoarchaeota archaeon]MBU2442374.1 hypothetical protein [Nanoarchaeota archaeon]